MKILHFADLHLDASFAGSGLPAGMAARRREELRASLRRIIDLALERQVDVVTIAGDLYEQERYTMDTGNFLQAHFARLGQVPVLVAPGNHDPWVTRSLYRQVDWTPNVHIFESETPYPYNIGDVTIWGAAHCSASCRENLIRDVRVPTGGMNLLLLHGSDTATLPNEKLAWCPFTQADVENAGFALALLGHYHRARLSPDRRPIVCYPGSPEPLGFDEAGEHYVLLVDTECSGVTASLLQVAHRPYAVLRLDVSQATTREHIRQDAVKLAQRDAMAHAVVRLHLTGVRQPDVDLPTDALSSDLSEHFGHVVIIDETVPAYDIAALAQDLTVKGTFVRKMMALRESCTDDRKRKTVRDALHLGLQALDRKELRPR